MSVLFRDALGRKTMNILVQNRVGGGEYPFGGVSAHLKKTKIITLCGLTGGGRGERGPSQDRLHTVHPGAKFQDDVTLTLCSATVTFNFRNRPKKTGRSRLAGTCSPWV